MSSVKFVVSHMDEQMGPFDEQELKGKWVKGEILPIDYVYDEAKQDWVLLAERFAWAANAQGDDIMPPPPVNVRTESVVSRRLNAELATKTVMASASAPASAAAPAPKVAAPSAEKALPVVSASTLTEPAPMTVDIIKINQEPVRLTPNHQPSKVKLTDGFGEIDLSPLAPGRVELVAQDNTLTGNEPLRIKVKPAEPVEVVWTIANQQTVGQDVELQIKALDEHGNVCLAYNDQFTLQIRGSGSKDIVVVTHDGQASMRLHQERAETWTMALVYTGSRRLRLPEKRSIEWQPGPAAKLVIDGPQEYTAGLPLKVQVRAVDLYGNIAKQYQGTVVLEVKAS